MQAVAVLGQLAAHSGELRERVAASGAVLEMVEVLAATRRWPVVQRAAAAAAANLASAPKPPMREVRLAHVGQITFRA